MSGVSPRTCALVLLGILVGIGNADAVLTIQITKGVEQALPIAIVPFGSHDGTVPPLEIAKVIAADLEGSGRFAPLPPEHMISRPHDLPEINFGDWRKLGMENLVVGKLSPAPGGGYQVDFRLVDVYKGQQLARYSIPGVAGQLRRVAHRISDIVYEKLTGIRGAFSTRVAYVTVQKDAGGTKTYELQIADADGAGPQTLFTSQQPLMSPAWSPDGKRLAYVSFEGHNSAIYVQNVETGAREAIASGPGLNSAPAWSPDGSRLAMTLSKDGDPEVYILDLGSRRLQRVTNDPAIDTEPAWCPDGSRLVFTSDRGGGPQVYEVSLSDGRLRRLTHEGDYNARASFSPDGKLLALVHRVGGAFRIAVLDLQTEQMSVLTDTGLDESPSFAPNNGMIIYATVGSIGSELAAISVDGRVRQRLALPQGEVREAAWGPFRK